MLKLDVNEGEANIEIEGSASQLMSEMFVALRIFHKSLKDEDEMVANAFLAALLDNFEDLFTKDGIKVHSVEVEKRRHRKR